MAPMAKPSKATKKFQSKKLDGVLKKRKEHKKVAQTFKSRKPDSGAKSRGQGDVTLPSTNPHAKTNKNEDVFESMDVDDFLEGGFELKAKSTSRSNHSIPNDLSDESHTESEVESDLEVDASQHQNQLKDLSKTDPEFFKFLQDNDADLLNFDGAEEEDLLLSDAEDHEETTETEALSLATVTKWEAQLKDVSLRCLRKVVLAFRAAAHLNEDSEKTYKYSIDDPEVFQKLVTVAIVGIPKFLTDYVPIKRSSQGKLRIPTNNKKFIKLIPLLKSHFASLLHFLQGISDSAMQQLVLNSSLGLIGYMLSFRRFLRDFMRTVLQIWSTSETAPTRISAFLLIREIVMVGDSGLRETALKLLYTAFVKEARNINVYSLPLVTLMKNTACDLFGVDLALSYQVIFAFLRQLAVVLRKSINEKQKESYKTVYNAQYMHSLDFWSAVLSRYAVTTDSILRPLIYPYVQVTLGAARLMPTAQFFPFKFHLLNSLNRLAKATYTFIPLTPLIFEILENSDMKKKPQPSTLKAMNFDIAVRAKQEYLKTKVYQEQVGDIAVEVLLEFYALNSRSIAFPELATPAIVHIKRYMKKTKNARLGRSLAAVVEKLLANSKFIEERRDSVNFNPKDLKSLDNFAQKLEIDQTPLGSYVKVQSKLRQEQRKMLNTADQDNGSEKRRSGHDLEDLRDSD